MEELSAVGEQVFDAECILNKRLRKVGLPGWVWLDLLGKCVCVLTGVRLLPDRASWSTW